MVKSRALVADIIADLKAQGDPGIALHSQGFFRTEKGGYGEGDIFLGIRVPVVRERAKRWNIKDVAIAEKLLKCEYHEVRFLALVALVKLYPKHKDQVYQIYISNIGFGYGINSWDLIDTSAPHIVGKYLQEKSQELNIINILNDLATSSDLWRRRVAVLATFPFIRSDDYEHTIRLCEMLLHDSHDLIHKATGWMLREIGKRDLATLTAFLDRHADTMPRTMLRYAIERIPNASRQLYLSAAKKRKEVHDRSNDEETIADEKKKTSAAKKKRKKH